MIFLTTDLERIRRRIAHQEDSPTDIIDYVAMLPPGPDIVFFLEKISLI